MPKKIKSVEIIRGTSSDKTRVVINRTKDGVLTKGKEYSHPTEARVDQWYGILHVTHDSLVASIQPSFSYVHLSVTYFLKE